MIVFFSVVLGSGLALLSTLMNSVVRALILEWRYAWKYQQQQKILSFYELQKALKAVNITTIEDLSRNTQNDKNGKASPKIAIIA